jgi:hypothetical protein
MAAVLLILVLVVCFSSAPCCTYTRSCCNGLAGLAGLLALIALIVFAFDLGPGLRDLHPFGSSANAAP